MPSRKMQKIPLSKRCVNKSAMWLGIEKRVYSSNSSHNSTILSCGSHIASKVTNVKCYNCMINPYAIKLVMNNCNKKRVFTCIPILK